MIILLSFAMGFIAGVVHQRSPLVALVLLLVVILLASGLLQLNG